jgi:hypothetical protein
MAEGLGLGGTTLCSRAFLVWLALTRISCKLQASVGSDSSI